MELAQPPGRGTGRRRCRRRPGGTGGEHRRAHLRAHLRARLPSSWCRWSGQVAAPGLVTLPAGSRVADALAAAGGLLPEADPASVNAAAPLTDGEQVAVGVPGAGGGAGATAAGGGAAPGLVDLNTATVADLDALPGIGPVLAQRVVDHRTAQGPFGSVQELDDVSGIGPALYAEISPLVTV